MRCYLDSSALARLVVSEPESPSLREFLKKSTVRITSGISETELGRVAARGDGRGVAASRRVLGVVLQIDVSREILAAAARLLPVSLRSLDAIHLATALELATDIDYFITYDAKLGAAAEQSGFTVVQPGNG